MRLSAGRYHSFVVRVWRGDGGGSPMHGQVTHVASHQSVGFTDLERMLEFIREQLTRQDAGTLGLAGAGGARGTGEASAAERGEVPEGDRGDPA